VRSRYPSGAKKLIFFIQGKLSFQFFLMDHDLAKKEASMINEFNGTCLDGGCIGSLTGE